MSLAPDVEEEFQSFENKVDEVMKILTLMTSRDKKEQELGSESADKYLGLDKAYLDNITKDNFIVNIKDDRSIINKPKSDDFEKPNSESADKYTFMAEMEKDADKRYAERIKRESLAQNLRKLGNQAYGDGDFARAINMYTKAIEQIKNSSVLYNNRALSYIRLNLYKRAIGDCDFVLGKLDEKNLRAWLYRAKAYYCLQDTYDYEKSIADAKKHNPKELNFIEQVINEIEKNTTKTDIIDNIDSTTNIVDNFN